MEQDINKLKSDMEDRARESFVLDDFFYYNLNNFAHRYFSPEACAPHKAGEAFVISDVESKLKDLIKSSDKEIANGVLNLAKEISFKKNPCVKYEIGIVPIKFDPSRGGLVEIYAEVNWGFPDFETTDKKFKRKSLEFQFDDVLTLRNKLAKHLESVCELFPEN